VATFFVVRHQSGPEWKPSAAMEDQSLWQEHAAFMDDLIESGFLVLGGPLAGGPRVGHMVEAESEDVVRETFAADPWNESHLKTDSLERWTLRLDARR
jgi:hypothetical protein